MDKIVPNIAACPECRRIDLRARYYARTIVGHCPMTGEKFTLPRYREMPKRKPKPRRKHAR
jgi:hypothetical protein